MFRQLQVMAKSTQKLHICEISVAVAAPAMPMWKTKMNRGARKTFSTAPVTMPTIAKRALPWKRI